MELIIFRRQAAVGGCKGKSFSQSGPTDSIDGQAVSVAPNESDSMCFCQSSSSAHTKFVITIMPQIAKFITFYQVSDDKIAGCTVVIV